jgi:hypothetical protein
MIELMPQYMTEEGTSSSKKKYSIFNIARSPLATAILIIDHLVAVSK